MKFICCVLLLLSLHTSLIQGDSKIFLSNLKALRSEKGVTHDSLEYDEDIRKEAPPLEEVKVSSGDWEVVILPKYAENGYAIIRGKIGKKINESEIDENRFLKEFKFDTELNTPQHLFCNPVYDKVAIKFYYGKDVDTPFVIIFRVPSIQDYVVRCICFLRKKFMDNPTMDALETVSNRMLNDIATQVKQDNAATDSNPDLNVQRVKIELPGSDSVALGIMKNLDLTMDNKSDLDISALLTPHARRIGVYYETVNPEEGDVTKTVHLVIVTESFDAFQIANKLWSTVVANRRFAEAQVKFPNTNPELNAIAEHKAASSITFKENACAPMATFSLGSKLFHGIVTRRNCAVADYHKDLHSVLTATVESMCNAQEAILYDKRNIDVGIGLAMVFEKLNHESYKYYWNMILMFEYAEP